LTGAIGGGESGPINQPPHPRARELAEMLLDAGADPNDSQGLYNSHFSPSDEWLELLLARGLSADAPANPDAPAETTLDFLLGKAVRTGLVERVRLLLAHGADASGRDDRYTHRTHVANAVLCGHAEVLELLVAHGAPRPELSAADRFRMAVVGGDAGEARHLLSEDASLSRQSALRGTFRAARLAAGARGIGSSWWPSDGRKGWQPPWSRSLGSSSRSGTMARPCLPPPKRGATRRLSSSSSGTAADDFRSAGNSTAMSL
jgi:hypothetical protein